jgi:hypothetical protein
MTAPTRCPVSKQPPPFPGGTALGQSIAFLPTSSGKSGRLWITHFIVDNSGLGWKTIGHNGSSVHQEFQEPGMSTVDYLAVMA